MKAWMKAWAALAVLGVGTVLMPAVQAQGGPSIDACTEYAEADVAFETANAEAEAAYEAAVQEAEAEAKESLSAYEVTQRKARSAYESVQNQRQAAYDAAESGAWTVFQTAALYASIRALRTR